MPDPTQTQPQPTSPNPQARRLLPKSTPLSGRLFRWTIYGLVGIGVGTIAILSFRPPPIAVDLATVEWGELVVAVEAEGQTRVRDRYVVSAPVAGRLDRLALKVGDAVAANQAIAWIDPLPLTSQVQALQAQIRALTAEKQGVATQRPKAAALAEAAARIQAAIAQQQAAQAQVRQVEAQLAQARREQDRLRSLQAQGAIPQQDLEQAELAVISRQRELEAAQQAVTRTTAEAAAAQQIEQRLQAEQADPDYLLRVYEARIQSLEAELANLSDQARRTALLAPTTGQVLRVFEESARYVAAGTPVLEIGNPHQLELVIDVLSSDAVNVQPGARVWVEQWGGAEPLAGQVRTIEPAAFTKVSALGVEEQRVNIIADLTEVPPTLGDAYRVETRIVVWEQPSVLTVPLSALFRCEPDWCVFVAVADRAQQRSVVKGQQNTLAAAIQAGLVAGDRVIVHPSEQIQNGSRIQVR